LTGVAPAHANRDADLDALRARIEQLQSELDETRGERDDVRASLRDTERRIGSLLRNLRDTESRIQHETRQLAALDRTRTRSRTELAGHRQELEQAVRAAWLLGRQEQLKLLLSQEDPARVSRALTYYRYLVQARATRLENLTAALSRLDALERKLQEQQHTLAGLRTGQLHEKQTLESARGERRQLLAQLNERVHSRSQEIERLRRDEQRLGRLVRELGTTLAQRPLPDVGAEIPSGGKGKWRLPVKGRLTARYGQPKAVGDLRWRGLFLASTEGAPVTAVTRGRVAYADWLRGFGLLLVLDHGHGLMTLYGHNQSLYKGVGDQVEAGETVALTGMTGGPPEPGLYFEVRENGEPRNPLDWCKL
jgi:septal ring factor EnvC (AmiA/AmiB activator)